MDSGHMAEPWEDGYVPPWEMTPRRRIDDCPVCGGAVTELDGEASARTNLDDEWFDKNIRREPDGEPQWTAKPCGHRVGKPTIHVDRIELVATA